MSDTLNHASGQVSGTDTHPRRDTDAANGGTKHPNLEAALRLLKRGLFTFPIHLRGLNEDGSEKWTQDTGWQELRIDDADAVRELWRPRTCRAIQPPKKYEPRVGLCTGAMNGVVGLDIDMKDGRDGLAILRSWGFDDPLSLSPCVVQTPSGGYHVYFANEGVEDLKNWVLKDAHNEAVGLDLRVQGGLMIAPTSVKAGRPYIEIKEPLGLAPLPPFPSNLCNAILQFRKDTKARRRALKGGVSAQASGFCVRAQLSGTAAQNVQEFVADHLDVLADNLAAMPANSGRNSALNDAAYWAGGAAAHNALTEAEAERVLRAAANACGIADEFECTFQSGFAAGLEAPLDDLPLEITADLFDVLDDEEKRPAHPSVALQWYGSIEPDRSAPYLIKGFLDEGTMSVLYGPSGSAKTYIVLDLTFHVTTGTPWRGKRTRQAAVLYLALEGGRGFMNRLAAIQKHTGIAGPLPFAVRAAGLDLLRAKADIQNVLDAAAEVRAAWPGLPLVIVVDTLSRAIAGGDENAPADMTRFVANLDIIREKTGAHILVVHHSGKDEARGARGHSSLRAATDTEIEVTASGGARLATVKKQRDYEDGEGFRFQLLPVELGVDEDGDPITSCVVEHILETDAADPLAGTTGAARVVLRELLRGIERRNMIVQWRNSLEVLDGVTFEDWPEIDGLAEDELRELAIAKADLSNSPRRDSRQKAWSRAVDTLIEQGRVCKREGVTRGAEIVLSP